MFGLRPQLDKDDRYSQKVEKLWGLFSEFGEFFFCLVGLVFVYFKSYFSCKLYKLEHPGIRNNSFFASHF